MAFHWKSMAATMALAITSLCIPGSTGAVELTIPFELVKNQIVLQVHFGEKGPYNFLLDTGFTPSGIDLSVARETGLLKSDSPVGNASGVGSNQMPLYAASLENMRLGSKQFESISALAMDFTHLGKVLGKPLQGVLGYNFLQNRRIRIDYPGRKVILDGEAAKISPSAKYYEGKLVFIAGATMPLLQDVIVNGRKVPVSLDTGSSLVLELFPDGAERAGIAAAQGAADTITGARGKEEVRIGEADTMELGALKLEKQEVILTERQRSGNRMGNLGNGFLKHFILTLDYIQGKITIEAPEEK